ncbi:hypothetical protein LSAT2_014177 [Lamellibrachia satsuma]|nr:hypothetical protein LSAT2_014177 [Lamellibrachia satsuma]
MFTHLGSRGAPDKEARGAMGCSSSRSTETGEGQRPNSTTPVESKDDATNDTAKTTNAVDDAVQNLVSELTISEEKAKAIVAKVNMDKNGETINDDLVALWEAIKAKKDEMKPRFQQYDVNDTGHVTLEEAMQILTKAFDGLPENGIRAMVKRYVVEDGGVNYNQFVYFYANVGAKNKELQKQFDELDQDDGHSLASDEVCKTIAVECALEEFMARSIVDDFDLTKDGRVNRAELNDLWQKLFG